MSPSFIIEREALQRRRNSKWRRFDAAVLPSWIADMDFEVSPAIKHAIAQVVDQGDYGYPRRAQIPAERIVTTAFANWMAEQHGWTGIDTSHVVCVTDLMQGCVASIMAFSEKGDGVVLNTPCYPPFRGCIEETGRRLVDNPLVDSGTRFELDLDAMESAIDARTRMILLCNPQNPTGRVFTRAELERIGQIAVRHDLVIFSDEIHADLTYPGQTHIPIASLGAEIAARCITASSATKSFNIPGLRCGVLHFGSGELLERFNAAIPRTLLGKPAITGIDATVAAWTESAGWLDEVSSHLTEVREVLRRAVADRMSAIRFYAPEATYLAWLDCSALGLDVPAAQFFLEQAKVGFSPGETFDAAYGQWVRFNMATSMPIAVEKIERMVEAYDTLGLPGHRA